MTLSLVEKTMEALQAAYDHYAPTMSSFGRLAPTSSPAVTRRVHAALSTIVVQKVPASTRSDKRDPPMDQNCGVDPGLLWWFAPEMAIHLVKKYPAHIMWDSKPPYGDFLDELDRRNEDQLPKTSTKRPLLENDEPAVREIEPVDRSAVRSDRKRRRTGKKTTSAAQDLSLDSRELPPLRKLASIRPKSGHARESPGLGTLGMIPPQQSKAPEPHLHTTTKPRPAPVAKKPALVLIQPALTLTEPALRGTEMVRQFNSSASVAPGMALRPPIMAETIFSDHYPPQTRDVPAPSTLQTVPSNFHMPQPSDPSVQNALEMAEFYNGTQAYDSHCFTASELERFTGNGVFQFYGSGPSRPANPTDFNGDTRQDFDFVSLAGWERDFGGSAFE